MRPLLFLVPLMLYANSARALGVDKFVHAVGSYGLTHASQAICNRATEGKHKTACLLTGIAIAGTIGAAKELLDQKRGTNTVKQSLHDGLADITGIGLAVIMIKIDF